MPVPDFVLRLFGAGTAKERAEQKRTASELYGHAVAWARAPGLYSELSVPDTPEGRLEMVLLHVALLLQRLQRDGEAAEPLAVALAERYVTDMDDCMREMGVSDLGVAKRVKKAAAALYDRTRDYTRALAEPDAVPLARLIATHTFGGGNERAADALAAYARDLAKRLAAAPLDSVIAGAVEAPAAVIGH